MSILTDLISKKITWSTAVSEIVQWGEHLTANDPTATAAVGAIISDAKQVASDAITMADSALGAFILPASHTVEAALETALAGATKGMSVPFNPLVSDGIDKIAAAVKSEADIWALKAKAALAAPVANTTTH